MWTTHKLLMEFKFQKGGKTSVEVFKISGTPSSTGTRLYVSKVRQEIQETG